MSYEIEEQMIIDDDTLSLAEKTQALKELYRDAQEQMYDNE